MWRFRWRKADNPWRQAPFSVTGVPTLIKVTADGVSHFIEIDSKSRTLMIGRNGSSWMMRASMTRRRLMTLLGSCEK
jgi:hypothetical protein